LPQAIQTSVTLGFILRSQKFLGIEDMDLDIFSLVSSDWILPVLLKCAAQLDEQKTL
jgi:hypothetical protein